MVQMRRTCSLLRLPVQLLANEGVTHSMLPQCDDDVDVMSELVRVLQELGMVNESVPWTPSRGCFLALALPQTDPTV